ncbi:MAG: S9 family peptidase [Prevotella sp.]|nr:S9 family peptidase [Prevotella sp.]
MINTLYTRLTHALLLILLALPMTAQKKLFTLEDLNFGGRNYHSLRPQNLFLTWWGDQLVQTDVEECYTIDTKTGKKKLLFTLDQVNKWAGCDGEKTQVRQLTYATFPYPDKPIVAVGNRRAFVLVDFKAKQIVWQDSISGQDAYDWSKDSRATAYVEDNQLFVVDANGNMQQLTTDGSREIVYGKSVHRDEFGIYKGTFWSPDGQRLAFYRMDQSMVTDYPQVDIDPREAEMEPDKYPMAGMNTHVVTIGVYDLKTKKTVYLKTPPVDVTATALEQTCYFTNISWSPDAKTIYMFELNRDQNDCRLVSYDAVTGERLTELCRETSDKYVEPLNPIQFLPWNNSQFIMQSRKDGYNHIYIYNVNGELIKQLTSGPWEVLDVLGFNEKQKSVIIASNEIHPLQRNLYSVDMASGYRTLLDNGEGVHRAKLSASGQMLYDKYSTPTTPNDINLQYTSTKSRYMKQRRINLLTAPDPWAEYVQPVFENGSIKAADGTTDLYWRMVKPHDFNPEQKYPTVVYVYGGPHAHNVDASWHWASRSWETYMAQKGYIVFILDNRGSENRGRDFEQATFRQLGQVEMQDQMKGVEYLRTLPYVDINRLGVHGWSYGGYMTISLMTNYPDVFKVGVAGGPVIDWQWYEVMYGERYMDTPQQNPEGYAKTSLISKAKNLKGKLQIIIGYNDPTVVPQHALSFLKSCIENGTQPDFFVYPGEGHNMAGHASVHLHERITQYFEDYLK